LWRRSLSLLGGLLARHHFDLTWPTFKDQSWQKREILTFGRVLFAVLDAALCFLLHR